MTSSITSSTNQSIDSCNSSLVRSGLSISVGDTKSIVLALQGLQGKIRALEQDRDYHQDQYESALRAHETYKLDMQRQAEQERAAHHRRERELMELIRSAQVEKSHLETTLSGHRRDDAAAIRYERDEAIAAEKAAASKREAALLAEVEKLRQALSEAHEVHARMQKSLDAAAHERHSVYAVNEQLRRAMDELLTQRETEMAAQPSHAAPLADVSHGSNSAGALPPHCTAAAAMRDSHHRMQQSGSAYLRRSSTAHPIMRHSSPRQHHFPPPPQQQSQQHARRKCQSRTRPQSLARHSVSPFTRDRVHSPQNRSTHRPIPHYPYQDPTCCSMLRSVHSMNGELQLPCSHDSSALPTSSMSLPRMHADRSRDVGEEGVALGTHYPAPPVLRDAQSRANSFAAHCGSGRAQTGTMLHMNTQSKPNGINTCDGKSNHIRRDQSFSTLNDVSRFAHRLAQHGVASQSVDANEDAAMDMGDEHSGAATGSARASRQSVHTPTTRAVQRAGATPLTSPPHSPAQRDSLCAIETQIRAELEELQLKFRHITARAREEDVSQDIITAALDRTSALIEQKQAQLRLMREARRELVSASHTNECSKDCDTMTGVDELSARRRGEYALDKSTQRSLLMNEVRTMMSDSKDKV